MPLTWNALADDAHAELVGVMFTLAVNTFADEKQLVTPTVTVTDSASSAVVGATDNDGVKPGEVGLQAGTTVRSA
jgi:hypothetical protein